MIFYRALSIGFCFVCCCCFVGATQTNFEFWRTCTWVLCRNLVHTLRCSSLRVQNIMYSYLSVYTGKDCTVDSRALE